LPSGDALLFEAEETADSGKGEDTLFVATHNEEAQLALYKRLGRHLKR
jgi:hypothetical protein